tara:strand:- start:111 stop:659 length:549 start_codon:yes stop_codon:yes gene_type:complete
MVNEKNKFIKTYSESELHILIPAYVDEALRRMSSFNPKSNYRYVPFEYIRNGIAEFSREDCIQESWKNALQEEAAFDLMAVVNRTVQQLAYQALLRHQLQRKKIIERAIQLADSRHINLALFLFEITDELTHNEEQYIEAVLFLDPKHSHHKTKIQRAARLSRRQAEAANASLQIKLYDLCA